MGTLVPVLQGQPPVGAYIGGVPDPSTSLSALPSVTARILAFLAICLGGVAGGFIGFALADVQCTGNCAVPHAIGIFAGSICSAGGTAIVAVLVLRALGEWRELADER